MRKRSKIIALLLFTLFVIIFGAMNIGVSDSVVVKDENREQSAGETSQLAQADTTVATETKNQEETTKDEEKTTVEETTAEETTEEETTTKKKKEEEETTAAEKGAPTQSAFYIYENGSRVKYTSYGANFTPGEVVASIDVFATEEDVISGEYFGTVWREYWEKYENAYEYKIGYTVVLKTENDGTIKKTILDPDDAQEIWDYMEVYLYDDVTQPPNTWYSHLTKEEMTDDTYVTSVKLRCGVNIEKVKSAKLRAFYYKGYSQFDEIGEYTGDDYIECKIVRK